MRPAPVPHLQSLGRRESLCDQIMDAVRAAIISGELKPRVVYSASMLGARFGGSPTPVREAMFDLVNFHLTLLGYGRNRYLVDVVSGLRTKTRPLGLTPLLDSGRPGRSRP